jgi:hypothetical protein
MITYECKRCGFTTKFKCSLIKHLQKKVACEARIMDIPREVLINEYVKTPRSDGYDCEFCGKFFQNAQGKYQHKLRCKGRHHLQDEKLEHLEAKIEELQKMILTQPHIISTTINNTTHTTQNIQHNNIIINLKPFGSENMSHIEHDKQFLTSCLLQRDIKSLIESIHCDKDHPENHNVRIKSLKQDLMETNVDGKWIITDKEETLDELINKGYRVFRFHSHKNKIDILDECDDSDEYEDIMNWLESIYEDNKMRKPIKRQLLILFLNNKALLLGKDISD